MTTIEVLRTRTIWFGRLARHHVKLDGVVVGRISSNKVWSTTVEPGLHRLQVTTSGGAYSEELKFQLRDGETRKFRCHPTGMSLSAASNVFNKVPLLSLSEVATFSLDSNG